MPFHSRELLEDWLDEFQRLGYSAWNSLRVIDQDGSQGSDTGLVTLDLTNAATTAYIEASAESGKRWEVTFEARDEAIALDAVRIAQLAAELVTLSALVAFLQAKATAVTPRS